MSELDIQKKYELTRTAEHSGYSGVGRNPNSNIRQAQPKRGLETGTLKRKTTETRSSKKPIEPWHVKKVGGEDSAAILPLTLVQGSKSNRVKVVPGTINGEVPTLSGTALDNATPPEITITGTKHVYAKVVGSISGDGFTYTVTIETTQPTEAISATSWTTGWLLGWATSSSGGMNITNVHSGGNLGATAFGNVTLWYKV